MLRLPQNRFLRPPGRRFRRSGGWSTPAGEGRRVSIVHATSTPHSPSRSEIDIQRSTLRWASSPPGCSFVQTSCVVVAGDDEADLADRDDDDDETDDDPSLSFLACAGSPILLTVGLTLTFALPLLSGR